MPSDRAYSAETRAARMAAEDMRKVLDSIRRAGAPLFMDVPRSRATQARHAAVMNSPAAKALLSQGYGLGFAYRVAQLEREQRRTDPLADLIDAGSAGVSEEPVNYDQMPGGAPRQGQHRWGNEWSGDADTSEWREEEGWGEHYANEGQRMREGRTMRG